MRDIANVGFEETFRVNTYECDFNREWKLSAIFQHMTEIAGLNASKLGVGIDDLMGQEYYWVHSRMKVEFYRYPQRNEIITIRTWPKSIQQKLFFMRDFEMLDSKGERLAAATSAWLLVQKNTRRLVPPQSAGLEFPQINDFHGLNEPLEKLNLSKDGKECLLADATYSAVDLLGHVNNSRYIEWICDSFDFDRFRLGEIDWLQINYDHEVLPGEQVKIIANQVDGDNNLWALEGINQVTEKRSFEAVVHWRIKKSTD